MHDISKMCCVELQGSDEELNIGINIINGQLKVIFPRGYRLNKSSKDVVGDILLLVKVLDKYSRRVKTKAIRFQNKHLGEEGGSKYPLVTAIWLINDYKQNGLFTNLVAEYKKDKKGKIIWDRTLKKCLPQISNSQFVYLEFIVRKTYQDSEDIIRTIHAQIINECLSTIGWLFRDIEKPTVSSAYLPKNLCMVALKNALSNETQDSRKQLLKQLINYLLLANDVNGKRVQKDYNTEFFNLIWEDMLLDVFGNADTNEYYPSATWHLGSLAQEASNLKPDVILRQQETVYVLDAKYYKYGCTLNPKHLPQSSDILKQLAYSEYIVDKHIKGTTKAYDAFILPCDNEHTQLKCIGYADIGDTMFRARKVAAVLMDTKTVMQMYVNNTKQQEYRKWIIQLIDQVNR